jgi:hypothetical protein
MSNINKFFGNIFAKKIKSKLEKDGHDISGLEKDSKKLKANQDQLDSELDIFCKMHPDSPLCKNRGKKMKW